MLFHLDMICTNLIPRIDEEAVDNQYSQTLLVLNTYHRNYGMEGILWEILNNCTLSCMDWLNTLHSEIADFLCSSLYKQINLDHYKIYS